jgi:acetyltransferase-like isoleucine patch superfamily enzyme
MIGQHVTILASNHRLDLLGCPPRESPWDESKTGVAIGDGCWIGADVVILPGVNIGDKSVVAAGAVVSKTVPPGEIWGGVPAKKLRAI